MAANATRIRYLRDILGAGLAASWILVTALGTSIGFLLFTGLMRPSDERLLWLFALNGILAVALQWGVLRLFRIEVDSLRWLILSALSWFLGGVAAWALMKAGVAGDWIIMLPAALLLGVSQSYALHSHSNRFALWPTWTPLTVVGLVGGALIANALDPEPLRRLPDPDTYKLVKGSILGATLGLCTMLPITVIHSRSGRPSTSSQRA